MDKPLNKLRIAFQQMGVSIASWRKINDALALGKSLNNKEQINIPKTMNLMRWVNDHYDYLSPDFKTTFMGIAVELIECDALFHFHPISLNLLKKGRDDTDSVVASDVQRIINTNSTRLFAGLREMPHEIAAWDAIAKASEAAKNDPENP